MVMMGRILVFAFLGVGLSASSWAHDGSVVKDRSDVTLAPSQQFNSEMTLQRSEVHVPAVHDHETSLADTCPQLAYEAEADGLRECVTVLTNQISDLLKLIMNLSEALAESQNQLMHRSHGPQGQSISPAAPQS